MEIKKARELLEFYIESGLNVHFHIFVIENNLELADILGLAHTEYWDKRFSRVY